MNLPSALILGVDTPIGLTVARELAVHGVSVHGIGRTARAIGGASNALNGFSVRGEGPLAGWLPARIRETGARALLAISEDDLVALAAMPADIEGCRILTPRAGPLAVALDKAQTLAIAQSLGIDVPESWQPQAGEDFAARAGSLRYPLIAKWSDPPAMVARLATAGLPLHKAERIDDSRMLLALLERYAGLGMWPLLQSFASGHGVGHMLHMAGGKATLRFGHRRIHEWPPEGGTSTLCEAVPPETQQAQFDKSEALLAAIGWEGPAMVEYRHDPQTGRFVLMEINGRFWGSQPLAFHCGAHFAWEQYCTAFGLPATTANQCHRRARFMIPETRRLVRVMRQGGGRMESLWRYLSGFFDPRMRYFVFSWRDPGPMLHDLANILRRGRP